MKITKYLLALAALTFIAPTFADDEKGEAEKKPGNEVSGEHNKGQQGEKMRDKNREKREKRRAERAERRKEHREKRDGTGQGHGKKGQN